MTIALDATYATGKQLSGVGVYSREILTCLAAHHPETHFLHCYRPHRLLRGWREKYPSNCSVRPLWEKTQWVRPDLFHGLNQRLPATQFRRSVVTFHDLFVMTAEYSTPEFRERFTRLARETAERADLIICVSRFTAGQVRDYLHVEESRLRVVHHGVRFSLPAGGKREPVILHVGAIQRRKNLPMLVKAFERAVGPPWQLVLAGGGGFGEEETLQAIEASSARGRIVRTGWIDDATLAGWYRRASMLAFPSLDEGFGIPAIEAMACGLPVLASNRGSLPEICGTGAWILDAENENEWASALRTMAESESIRREWAERGSSRQLSTWEQAAERTWAVYEELR